MIKVKYSQLVKNRACKRGLYRFTMNRWVRTFILNQPVPLSKIAYRGMDNISTDIEWFLHLLVSKLTKTERSYLVETIRERIFFLTNLDPAAAKDPYVKQISNVLKRYDNRDDKAYWAIVLLSNIFCFEPRWTFRGMKEYEDIIREAVYTCKIEVKWK